jgi:homoserine O-succinyltransferase
MTAQSVTSVQRYRGVGARSRRLVVGLVNNMSDGALRATEAQFCALVRRAAPPGFAISFRFFSLPEVGRSDEMRGYMRGRYGSIDELERDGVDALVVTGAEPRRARFEDEPYWRSLVRVIDWAQAEQVPTVWSCLAAHAAVWRRHGIARRRGEAKRCGVFALRRSAGRRWLEDPPASLFAPHSRWNDLDAAQLESAGFEILTCCDEIGVDTFVQTGRATSIFFQGHPEYDAGTLGREYLRDVSRYLRGQQPLLPAPPRNYFDHLAMQALADLSTRLQSVRDPELLAQVTGVVERRTPDAPWRAWAAHAYRMWLSQFCDPVADDRLVAALRRAD